MNAKTWIPLALAIVMGLVAAVVGKSMMSRNHTVAAPAAKTSQMVVIKDSVSPGQTLTEMDLAVTPVPPESMPTAAFNKPADVVGRTVTLQMSKGQPVMEPLLAPQGAGTGLSALVPDGMRAITVDVNEITGVAGLLQPGCRVDLVGTVGSQNPDETVSRTLVENLKVVAIGQKISNAAPKEGDAPVAAGHSVTLLVTPKEATLVELASRYANPRLVLRGGIDGTKSDHDGITLCELRGQQAKGTSVQTIIQQAAPTTAPSPLPATPIRLDTNAEERHTRVVQVIKGTTESNVTFQIISKPAGTITGDSDQQQQIAPDNH